MSETLPSPADLAAHTDFLRGLARVLVGDDHRAEDVVQEAMVAALVKPPRRAGNVRGWLVGVVRNVSLMTRRSEGRRAHRERTAPRNDSSPAAREIAEQNEVSRAIADRVLALPDPYREVLVRRYFDGLTLREIATEAGVPVATVQTRHRRAIQRLRADLRSDGRRNRSLLPGVLVMSAKKQVAIAAALVLAALLSAWIISEQFGEAEGPPGPPDATVMASGEIEDAPGSVPDPEPATEPESGATADAPAAPPEPTAGPEAPEAAITPGAPDPEFTGDMDGVVTDLSTGEPIAGARVLYVVITEYPLNWWGASTDAEGKFRIRSKKARPRPGEQLELRVGSKAYRTWRGLPSARPVIALDPEPRPLIPGRIRGIALGSDLKPIIGFLDVITIDELSASVHRFTVASDLGRFVIEGVAPGRQEVFLDWRSRWKEGWCDVFVPEDGETFVSVRAPKPAVLYEPAHPEQGARREVRIAGLPTDGPAWLLAPGPSGVWRARVEDGAARFPTLLCGDRMLILERPGQPDVRRSLELKSGEGPVTVKFASLTER